MSALDGVSALLMVGALGAAAAVAFAPVAARPIGWHSRCLASQVCCAGPACSLLRSSR
jgi:hypothetical protein